jgi:hypothetical protein
VALVYRAPVIRHARKRPGWRRFGGRHAKHLARAGDLQVRVTLVVTEQDVELGVQRFDEIVLQQQRLGFGAHHRGLHAHDLAHHLANARAVVRFLEIAADALLQVARLAHVEQLPLCIEIAVHARQPWQGRDFAQQLFGMHV